MSNYTIYIGLVVILTLLLGAYKNYRSSKKLSRETTTAAKGIVEETYVNDLNETLNIGFDKYIFISVKTITSVNKPASGKIEEEYTYKKGSVDTMLKRVQPHYEDMDSYSEGITVDIG